MSVRSAVHLVIQGDDFKIHEKSPNPMSGCMSRRALLNGVAVAGAAGFVLLGSGCQTLGSKRPDAWELAKQIRKSIDAPQFPNRVFDIRDFGASPDLVSNNNGLAIQSAIEACHKAGGGKVLVSGGRFSCGSIKLLSNVNLHLDRTATLAFSTDPLAYLPLVKTRWEGMELMGLSPLIYAFQQVNIAITGEGVLDGQASDANWWPWKGQSWKGQSGKAQKDAGGAALNRNQNKARKKLQEDVKNAVPVNERIFDQGAYLRPPFVQTYECKNILIQGITLKNAPFWLLHPVLCENVTIDSVTCASHGPNNDGCDPESCKNVLIQNCFFDTGDDCIAIKSGRNADGRRLNVPAENILISDCKMRSGHGGVVIGSEISGGVRNVFAERCEMSSKDLERGIRIKTNSVRGGLIENLHFRDISIGEVQDAIVIDFNYEEGDAGEFTPTVQNISIENLVCDKAKSVFQVRGYARSPINNLQLKNCEFKRVQALGALEHLSKFLAEKVLINGVPLAVPKT